MAKFTGRQYAVGRIGTRSSVAPDLSQSMAKGTAQVVSELGKMESAFQRASARHAERLGTLEAEEAANTFLDENGDIKRDEDGNILAPKVDETLWPTVRNEAYRAVLNKRFFDAAVTDIAKHDAMIYQGITEGENGQKTLNRLNPEEYDRMSREYERGYLERAPVELHNALKQTFREARSKRLIQIDDNLVTLETKRTQESVLGEVARTINRASESVREFGSGALIDMSEDQGPDNINALLGNTLGILESAVDGGFVDPKTASGLTRALAGEIAYAETQHQIFTENNVRLRQTWDELVEEMDLKGKNPSADQLKVAMARFKVRIDADIDQMLTHGKQIVAIPEYDGAKVNWQYNTVDHFFTSKERQVLARQAKNELAARMSEQAGVIAAQETADMDRITQQVIDLIGSRSIEEGRRHEETLRTTIDESIARNANLTALNRVHNILAGFVDVETNNEKLEATPDSTWAAVADMFPSVRDGEFNYLAPTAEWNASRHRMTKEEYEVQQRKRMAALTAYNSQRGDNVILSHVAQWATEVDNRAQRNLDKDQMAMLAIRAGDEETFRQRQAAFRAHSMTIIGDPVAPTEKKYIKDMDSLTARDWGGDANDPEYIQSYTNMRKLHLPSQSWINHMKFGMAGDTVMNAEAVNNRLMHYEKLTEGDPYLKGLLKSEKALGANHVAYYEFMRLQKGNFELQPQLLDAGRKILNEGIESVSPLKNKDLDIVRGKVMDGMEANAIDPLYRNLVSDENLLYASMMWGGEIDPDNGDMIDFFVDNILGQMSGGPGSLGSDAYTYTAGRGRLQRDTWGDVKIWTADAVTSHWPENPATRPFYATDVPNMVKQFDGDGNVDGYDLDFADDTFLAPTRKSQNRSDKVREYQLMHIMAGGQAVPVLDARTGSPVVLNIGDAYEKYLKENKSSMIETLFRQFGTTGDLPMGVEGE